MDYEKALEKARAAYGTGAYDDATLEFLFPQLKESEDERVRKCLVSMVNKTIWDSANPASKKECLAYLEKQKENPKSADSIPADCVSDVKCGNSRHKVGDSLEGRKLADEVVAYLIKSGYQPIIKDTLDQKHFQIKIPRYKEDFFQSKEYKHCREILDEYYYEGDFAGDVYTLYVLRQKEQKPVEYLSKDKVYAIMNKLTELSTSELIPLNSDEYKKINEITSDIRSLLDYPIGQKPVDYDHEMWKNCEANFEGGKKEVIEHPEKYGLQKPDTRDADDLQLLGFIYDLLNEIDWKDNWAMSKDECLRRLNNYRPQKSAEWSEDWREEDIQTRFAFYTYKDDSSVLYLSNVFVEETSRNHGFGTRILKAAEKVAETIGATTISLKVKQDSPANAWYRKNGYGYVAFEDGYDWLEKNLEYMKPNKQEWSEEDEEMLNSCISSIEESKENRYAYKETDGDTSYDHEIAWLKSIRPPQDRCKDSPHRGDMFLLTQGFKSGKHELAIKFMNYLDENRPEDKMSLSNSECEDIDKAFKENDWAKIVRYVEKFMPHWKPSREQMDSLRDTIVNTKGYSYSMYLPELYEQLKKL